MTVPSSGFVAASLAADPGLAEMIAASDAQKPAGLVDLSIGDPDLPCDPRVIEAAFDDARAGLTHYSDPFGDGDLIWAVRLAWQQDYDLELAGREVMVTASATHAMSLLMDAVLDPGDEVVLFSPYFTPYAAQVRRAGGVVVEAPCDPASGFVPTPDLLASVLTDRTKAVVVNNPNNPTGVCLTQSQLQGLVDLCREHHVLLVSDEIYTSFCFFGSFVPVLWCDGARETCATVRSFSKDYCMSGWRVGYVVAPPDVVAAMRAANEANVYVAATPSQRAAVAAVGLRHEIRRHVHEIFGERFRHGLAAAGRLPGVSVPTSRGGLYLFLDVRDTGLDDTAFTALMERHGVRLLSGSGFGSAGSGFCRLALRVPVPELDRAFDRMARALASPAAAEVLDFSERRGEAAGQASTR